MARTPQENKNRTSVQYQQRLILILDESGLTKKILQKKLILTKKLFQEVLLMELFPVCALLLN